MLYKAAVKSTVALWHEKRNRRRVMKRSKSVKWISCILITILCFMSGFTVLDHKIEAGENDILEDGTYTMQSFLKNATSDQASMGNAGIVQPVQVIVQNGKCTIRVECKALSTKRGKIDFTGYLAQMSYFPNWKPASGKVEEPKNETPIPLNIESYFENTYDQYNDPKTGTDSKVKGKLYPHYMNFPVEYKENEMWVQVYVPVMEEISKGSGLQYARFQFDWSTLKKVSDETKIQPSITTEQKNQTTTTASKKKTTAKTKKTTASKLNIKKLDNGIYSIKATMLKTDKKTQSMANDAINHKVKLTVKNGKYYVTLDFKGLNVGSSHGYLSKIKYFTEGYKINSYKVPTGTLKNVTINSYQKDTKGKKVTDSYGTNYPDKVTFPLIKSALNNGYVPLQVFVPIMDAISPGSGTQAMYLKLDLNSIKKVTNSNVFQSKDKNTVTNTTATTGTTKSASDHKTVTIKTATLPKTSESKNSNTSTQTTQIGNGVSTNQTVHVDQSASTDKATDSQEDDQPIVVPSVMSVLLSIAGIFYKVKSRG